MNALWMPWNLIYIPSYEACKRSWYYYYLDLHHEKVAVSVSRGNIVSEADPPMQKLLPLWAFPLCSSVCAAAAAICTHPIDVIKTRLQVHFMCVREGDWVSFALSTKRAAVLVPLIPKLFLATRLLGSSTSCPLLRYIVASEPPSASTHTASLAL